MPHILKNLFVPAGMSLVSPYIIFKVRRFINSINDCSLNDGQKRHTIRTGFQNAIQKKPERKKQVASILLKMLNDDNYTAIKRVIAANELVRLAILALSITEHKIDLSPIKEALKQNQYLILKFQDNPNTQDVTKYLLHGTNAQQPTPRTTGISLSSLQLKI